MSYTLRCHKLLAVLAVCFVLAGGANAAVIVSLPGDAGGTPLDLGGGIEQSLAASWSQDFSLLAGFINVYNLRNLDVQEPLTVHFDLIFGDVNNPAIYGTDAVVDPDTTAADTLLLFAPLNLGPGTWFLVGSATGFEGAWLTGNAGARTAAPGAAFGTEYLKNAEYPDFTSEFNPLDLGFQGSGDVGGAGAIPEPATWVLMGAGLILAGVVRRRRRA